MVNLSAIDVAADRYLNKSVFPTNKYLTTPKELFIHKAARFCFPPTDEDINRYSFSRSPPEIIQNIIRVLAGKLKPQEYNLWNELCQRDIATPEYYASGLAMLRSDLSKLSKKYKIDHERLPTPTDMSPVQTNIALIKNQGQMDLKEITHSIQQHIDTGYRIFHFLHRDNALIIIPALLNICTKPAVLKLLNRYHKILKQGASLSVRARRKLSAVVRTHLPLTSNKTQQRNTAIQINLAESISKLPFVEVIFTHISPLPDQLATFPIQRALCDTGSDCSLIPFKLFKAMGFKSSCLMKEPKYNIKGSTGLEKDVVLGGVHLHLYIKSTNGTFGRVKHKFLVCHPCLQLDNILLGLDVLSVMKADIHCDGLKITADLQDNTNKLIKMDLFTVNSKQVTAYLTNIENIQTGQSHGAFSLTNYTNSNLTECQIKSTHRSLNLSFEAISLQTEGQVFAAGSAVYPLHVSNTYIIPFVATSDIPAGSCQLNLEQVKYNYCAQQQESRTTDLSRNSLQLPNTSDTLANSLPVPNASEVKLETQNLLAGVNKLVAKEESGRLTVEDEIDSQSLDRMSIDTTFALKNQINLSHLNKTEISKVNSIIDDYPQVWAADKYSIGSFTGFDAHIRVLDGSTAWQKERRCPQEDGIRQTMTGLIDSGVFELAMELDHVVS